LRRHPPAHYCEESSPNASAGRGRTPGIGRVRARRIGACAEGVSPRKSVMSNKLTVIISEARPGEPEHPALQQELAGVLHDWDGVDVAIVPHLYDLAPDGPGVEYLRSVDGDMVVLSHLYPRAAFWVLDANEVRGRLGRSSFWPEADADSQDAAAEQVAADEARRTIWCIDLREHVEAEPLLAELERIATEKGSELFSAAKNSSDPFSNGMTRIEEVTQPRWYPVVDRGRCGNCLECLNFCLFGVFSTDVSGELLIEQPDACRDGCPACARVCPSAAIMFPHFNNPAIAGDPKAKPEQRHVTLIDFFGPTPPTAPSPADLATAEREQALKELAEAQRRSGAKHPPAEKPAAPADDDLDRLVDEVDGMEL